MMENIALIASATWLLTAVVTGIAERRFALSGPDKQGVAFVIATLVTFAGAYTGFITGNPVEIGLLVIVALFGANLIHDKVEEPVREKLSYDEKVDVEERLRE